MTWTVVIERAADKALARFPAHDRKRILLALDALAADPFAARNVKPLKGRSDYRLRVGDYRVIYELENERLIVLVIEVSQRGGAYR